MKIRKNTSDRPGAALLVVLFIVMAITITALGFISQSDVELACGQNMVLHKQMDYLAESGLEHARGLILNPQDVASEYWAGSAGLQLVSGSDYYDVAVTRDSNDLCNYIIDCNSYRLDGMEKVGRSRLRAELRLDPCIAYWVGSDTTVFSNMNIKGDVYCGGTLTNSGTINGDVFAVGTISGTSPQGQEKPAAQAGVIWPNLVVGEFQPAYYIGPTSYPAHQIVDADIPSSSLEGVWYRTGDVTMPGNVTISGTLVVNGDLTISGANNVITAEPRFPALLVTGQVVMEQGSALVVNGLAQIGQGISIDAGAASASIQVAGGLFIANGGVTSDKVLVNITGAPAIASIEIWSETGVPRRWGPAGGAFFRSVERIR